MDGEFALVVRRCGLAFLEEAYRGALEGLALIVGYGSANGIGRCGATECQKARRCQKIRYFVCHEYSFSPSS